MKTVPVPENYYLLPEEKLDELSSLSSAIEELRHITPMLEEVLVLLRANKDTIAKMQAIPRKKRRPKKVVPVDIEAVPEEYRPTEADRARVRRTLYRMGMRPKKEEDNGS